jgi:outer membrane protein
MNVQNARRGAPAAICAGLLLLIAVPVPAATTAAGADSAAAAAAPLPVLTLSECVDIALHSSLAIASAGASRDQAASGVTGAYGSFLPSISLNAQSGKNEHTDLGVELSDGVYGDNTFTSSSSSYGGSVGLNVFDGLRKYGSLKSARASLKAADASAGYTREQVIVNVAAAYFNLLRYERLLEVAAESRDLAAKELDRMDVYFKLGSAARSDVLQSKVRHEQTKLEVVRAQNSVEQAFANLAYSMNRPLAQRFAIERAALATDFSLDALDALYAEALQKRLDLQSREYGVEAAHGDFLAAQAGFWPSLDLFRSYSHSKNESPYRFGAQKAEDWSWGYRVSWSIFDRLQTVSGRSQAKARERAADYQLQQARLDAQLEVRQIYNSLVEARERASLSRETITQAEEALRLAEERFRVGAGTTLDTITAQVNLAKARSDEVQAVCDYLINAAALDRAVGRAVRYLGSGS